MVAKGRWEGLVENDVLGCGDGIFSDTEVWGMFLGLLCDYTKSQTQAPFEQNKSSIEFIFRALLSLWMEPLKKKNSPKMAKAKIVERQVARKVELHSTFGNGSCNDFGRCRACYTVKCFGQVVPPQCRQNIARQVARNTSQSNSTFRVFKEATVDNNPADVRWIKWLDLIGVITS